MLGSDSGLDSVPVPEGEPGRGLVASLPPSATRLCTASLDTGVTRSSLLAISSSLETAVAAGGALEVALLRLKRSPARDGK